MATTRHHAFILLFGNDDKNITSFAVGDRETINHGLWVNPMTNPSVASILQVPARKVKTTLAEANRLEVSYQVFSELKKATATISEMMNF